MPKNEIDLSAMDPIMKKAIQNMVFGEAADSDNETTKMIIQSALSRYLSGKPEFSGKNGTTMADIINKPGGYYAVTKDGGNKPYNQALKGKFPDLKSKARYAEIEKHIDAVLGDGDYSKNHAQFYFTDEEEKRIRDAGERGKKEFDFSKVKPRGRIGQYNTYGY